MSHLQSNDRFLVALVKLLGTFDAAELETHRGGLTRLVDDALAARPGRGLEPLGHDAPLVVVQRMAAALVGVGVGVGAEPGGLRFDELTTEPARAHNLLLAANPLLPADPAALGQVIAHRVETTGYRLLGAVASPDGEVCGIVGFHRGLSAADGMHLMIDDLVGSDEVIQALLDQVLLRAEREGMCVVLAEWVEGQAGRSSGHNPFVAAGFAPVSTAYRFDVRADRRPEPPAVLSS